MPSYMHPRSRTTTSLFGTTLLVSFLVVGMPHIFPCPAPRVHFADAESSEDGRRRRRSRRPASQEDSQKGSILPAEKGVDDFAMEMDDRDIMRRKAHECPVPKPSGRIGEILGFKKSDAQETVTQEAPNAQDTRS